MRRLSPQQYIEGVLSGDRFALSRAITLVESNLASDEAIAQEVLQKVLPHAQARETLRVGITGVPGVGKSTFIETFGMHLIERGHKVAVLAIDPSSQRSGGSIMGDKTRMERLSMHASAYIRPSASGSTLGGVARKTREAMLLCEAAGFDYVLIETVGVGQSEVAVKEICDFFLLLMLAGAGDELQGIKKGIMEMADAIAITKADGDNVRNAKRAQATYRSALHLFPPHESGWIPQVLTCSAAEKTGIADIADMLAQYRSHAVLKGFLAQNRQSQLLHWLQDALHEALLSRFYQHPEVNLQEIRRRVAKGELGIPSAVKMLLQQAGI
jgi:LAO/AO transport system kinase